MIGDKIRQLRRERSLSLAQLAKRTGVSDSYISQLECGSMDPSVSILRKISRELQVPVSAFFDEDCPPPVYLPANQKGSLAVTSDGVSYRYLSPHPKDFSGKLSMLLFEIPAGMDTDLRQSQGETCIFLHSGTLRVLLEDHTCQMAPGDSMNIRRNVSYRLSNPGGAPASGIVGIARK